MVVGQVRRGRLVHEPFANASLSKLGHAVITEWIVTAPAERGVNGPRAACAADVGVIASLAKSPELVRRAIAREPDDLFQSTQINYHYIDVTVQGSKMVATMNRLELKNGAASWSQPDKVTISVPAAVKKAASTAR